MSTEIRFLGMAGFEIVARDLRVLIDPFLTGNPRAPVQPDDIETPTVILVTHAAFDHLGDAAVIARRTGSPVICDGAVRRVLMDRGVPSEQIRAVTWGLLVELCGARIRPVECRHRSVAELADGTTISDTPLAFIVEVEPGCLVYHCGDTSIFDMRLIGNLYRPTVALLGCTIDVEIARQIPGPGRLVSGEMSPDECAVVAEMLGVELAIACHYLTPDENVARFLKVVPASDPTGRRRAIALEPGASTVFEGTRDRSTSRAVE